jgi:hypothetical protein
MELDHGLYIKGNEWGVYSNYTVYGNPESTADFILAELVPVNLSRFDPWSDPARVSYEGLTAVEHFVHVSLTHSFRVLPVGGCSSEFI